MRFHVLTLFPDMIRQGFSESITGRAMNAGLLDLEVYNIRDYAEPARKRRVDDYPYGGGAGMVMQAEPVYGAWLAAVEAAAAEVSGADDPGETAAEEGGADITAESFEAAESCAANCADSSDKPRKVRTIFLTPGGKVFDQKMAREFARESELILLCGHYEGVDERVIEEIVTDQVSIGDYVLTGGELPALVIMDAVSRMVPGVLGNSESAMSESFEGNLLEYPQYSRPEVWHGQSVPPVLLSGHHKNVDIWRRQQSIARTLKNRPDLLKDAELDKKDRKYLQDLLAMQDET